MTNTEQQSVHVKRPAVVADVEAVLRERLVVDKEEYEKHGVGSGECNPGDDVDRLRHSDRMRRFFFANLDETWLKEINLQMNDDTVSEYCDFTMM